jgi:site-specific DNA-cytosine methylase
VGTTIESQTILSLCPGIRGLERGIERVIGKLHVAAYVEIEAFIIENLIAQMEAGLLDPAPVWTNLKTFGWKPFRGKIHGIIGGYPCQPFSVAGARGGTNDPRHLWPFIQKGIQALRPDWCFFENVRGHLSMGYDIVQKDLFDLGYNVESGVFTAEEIGAPHRRERLFILAIRKDILADAHSNGYRNRTGKTAITGGTFEGTEQWEERYETFRERLWNEFGNRSTKLANASDFARHISESIEWKENIEAGRCSSELVELIQRMVNPYHDGQQRTSSTASTGKDDTQRRQERTTSFGIGGTGTTTGKLSENKTGNGSLGNSAGLGIQGSRTEGKQVPDSWFKSWLFECAGRGINDRWPGRPNQEQYEWEEARTVKPGVGCTVNGYDFREDLLRAFGNSVVEQTAALAFTTLLSKHFNK